MLCYFQRAIISGFDTGQRRHVFLLSLVPTGDSRARHFVMEGSLDCFD